MDRLSALDASLLAIEDATVHMHLVATLIFEAGPLRREDGSLDFPAIRDYVASRLYRVPRNRQRLAASPISGSPIWVDDPDFNLDYHVRHTALAQPRTDRVLKRLVGRIASQKLDHGKPLWELWVVEGLEQDRFAVILKAHHCMIDGISGIEVISTLLRSTPAASIEPAPLWKPRPAPGWLAGALGEATRLAALPLGLARLGIETLRHPGEALERVREGAQALGDAITTAFSPAASTPFNPAHIGPHRRFDTARFDLAQLDEVRQRLGGTRNDVVLATLAGALGRVLRARGVDHHDYDFRAALPVSVRHEGERGALEGEASMAMTTLPIDETDPRKRLEAVLATRGAAKRSHDLEGMEMLERLGTLLPTGWIALAARLAGWLRTFNLVISNATGPSHPLYLLGARLLEPYPAIPLYANQALGIALFAYDGALYVGLNSDWDRVPDLHDLAEALVLEFEALGKAAAPAAADG